MSFPGQQVGAVIMAGGKGSRLGTLGRGLPKCLFPVLPERTLLTRLMDQVHSAGVPQTTVCCSPENVAVIRAALQQYRRSAKPSQGRLQAVSCPKSRLGLLPALAEVLAAAPTQWYWVCLGDIFFARPPFPGLIAGVNGNTPVEGWLLTGTDLRHRDGSGTGAVACQGKAVRGIAYDPLELPPVRAGKVRRWTGSFLFRRELLADLNEHLAEYKQAPFEDWIDGLLHRGARCRWQDAGPFVNVNSAPDYRFLVTHQVRLNAA